MSTHFVFYILVLLRMFAICPLFISVDSRPDFHVIGLCTVIPILAFVIGIILGVLLVIFICLKWPKNKGKMQYTIILLLLQPLS